VGEIWVAASLLALAAFMLARNIPPRSLVAGLFVLAGAIHGYALGAGVSGAEATPVVAYLAGLTVVLSLIAAGAWAVAHLLQRRHPALPLARFAGAAVGLAGLGFAAAAVLG